MACFGDAQGQTLLCPELQGWSEFTHFTQLRNIREVVLSSSKYPMMKRLGQESSPTEINSQTYSFFDPLQNSRLRLPQTWPSHLRFRSMAERSYRSTACSFESALSEFYGVQSPVDPQQRSSTLPNRCIGFEGQECGKNLIRRGGTIPTRQRKEHRIGWMVSKQHLHHCSTENPRIMSKFPFLELIFSSTIYRRIQSLAYQHKHPRFLLHFPARDFGSQAFFG